MATAPAGTGLPPLLVVNLRAVSWAEGVRAGLALALVVALGQWVRVPGLMESALAAYLTCLCDAGGPVQRRLPALFTFGMVGTAVTTGFPILGNGPAWLVAVCATLAVFVMSFARVYGQSAMQVGNLLTVVLVLAVRGPLDLRRAGIEGGMFLLGNAWAILLTMVIWRVRPYQPVRRAVAQVFRRLAAMAADLSRLLAAGTTDQAEWERHARLHRRSVREAIEQARGVVLDTVRARGPAGGRASQSWVRLEAADQLFGALIALSDLLEYSSDPASAQRAARMLRLLGSVLLLQARAVLTEQIARRPGMDRAVAAIATVGQPAHGEPDALARLASTMGDRLRISMRLSDPSANLVAASSGPRVKWWAVARANLSPDSAVLRHALRASVLAGLAIAATLYWPRPYEYWFTITLVLTIQPYFALTFTRAVERVGGTVLGGILAAAIAMVATTPLVMSVALFPLTVLALAVRAVSFGLFMAFVTPVIVLLSELGNPGTGELTVALFRAAFTVAGGVLALAAAWLMWPVWEPARVDKELRLAILAHGRYAATEIAAILGEASSDAVTQARRAAGLASNALEASLQRALLEPRPGMVARIEAALTVDAALRRMAGRLSMLHVAAKTHPARDPAVWRRWADWIAAATANAADREAAALPPPPELPKDDPDADSLARLAGQLEVLAGASARLADAAVLAPAGAAR